MNDILQDSTKKTNFDEYKQLHEKNLIYSPIKRNYFLFKFSIIQTSFN